MEEQRPVCIGIHVHAELTRLRATLDSLRVHSPWARLVLLPDSPDQRTAAVLRQIDLPQLATHEPLGPAACFNRLFAYAQSDVIVLLESGSVVGPGWLEAILKALDAAPENGLAGPSTNRAWNEQCVFPEAKGTPDEVAKTAREARDRFGGQWLRLEPLHSLADFCYAARREVIDRIGAADEAYGLGPCWEMDYNIRAARAGFRGVWACSSYVYRAPFTARREKEEARRFAKSRERYQDKFCGLRLAKEQTEYELHCRGDACEHFAPPQLIQVRLPLASPTDTPGLRPETRSGPSCVNRPLVSCIMATRDRLDFVLQSIRYFLRQDYPNRELIILDDGSEDLANQIELDERVRYVKLPRRLSIGAKRNRGCELARGSLIAHWDDDDWYSASRLSLQIEPLLAGRADITGLQAGIFLDLLSWTFWRCTSELHRHLFVEDVHGGTLTYRKSCWERVQYPDLSLAEDARFLRQAKRCGARLERIANDNSFIYLRHGANAWSFQCGKHIDPRGWYTVPEPELPGEDRQFYHAQSLARNKMSPGTSVEASASDTPLVTCIMPTADRRPLVAQSMRYFLRQDYPNRELIIVDDGVDAIADLIPEDRRISYIRLKTRRTIGEKRNLACERSRGQLIAHWDDDDWSADWRLSYQVNALGESGTKSACGLTSILYYDPCRERAWCYVYPEHRRRWVAGNTLCYRKELWQQHRFPHLNQGEDTRFVWSLPQTSILPLPNNKFYVATLHQRNSSPKRTQEPWWNPCSSLEVQSVMGTDFCFYRNWSSWIAVHRPNPNYLLR